MFQIGATLRQARLARGLELETVASRTMIRVRYLSALEEERFHDLPGDAYARGFLREYAKALDLDPQPFLDELDSRLREEEPAPVLLVPTSRRRLPAARRAAVLGAAAAAVAIGLLAWKFGGGGGSKLPAPARPSRSAVGARRPVRHPVRRRVRPATPAKPKPLQLLLSATRGDTWLSVRLGSATGPVLYEGLLTAGKTLRFHRQGLWIRIGAPWNLDVSVNGRKLRGLPPDTGNVLVAGSALHPA